LLVHEGHASARRFFTQTNADSYDFVVRFATFGQDLAWKHQILEAIGTHYNYVLELACGTGILSFMLARAGKSVTGLDLTHEYLTRANRRIELPLVQGTAEVLPYRSESFDVTVSSYLAKYVNVQKVVEECDRVLRPGGKIVFHDFTYPKNSTLLNLWKAYFFILRRVGRLATSWRTVFEQLDEVIRKSDWVDKTEDAFHERGFHNITRRYYTGYTAAIITAEKP